eukprot:scaffold19060_cov62-Phaeocystis_antarctica.AAC.6
MTSSGSCGTKREGISPSRPSGLPPLVAQSRVKPPMSPHLPCSAFCLFQWYAWNGRRSGHSASAGSAAATTCTAAAVTSATSAAAAAAGTGAAASVTAGMAASACSVRLLGGSLSFASPDASTSSRVSTRFCCCTSEAIERSRLALEAEGRLVEEPSWSCWRSTREMKTTHSSSAPPKSSWCSFIRMLGRTRACYRRVATVARRLGRRMPCLVPCVAPPTTTCLAFRNFLPQVPKTEKVLRAAALR